MNWTKKSRIAVAILSIILATASLVIFSQMNQVAEAAILTPVESPIHMTPILYDDFSIDLSQWTVISGTWTLETEECSQSNVTNPDAHIWAGDISWADYEMETRVKLMAGGVGAQDGIVFRCTDMWVGIDAMKGYVATATVDTLYLGWMDGSWHTIEKATVDNALGTWHTIKVGVVGHGIKVYWDDVLKIDIVDTRYDRGYIGLRSRLAHAHFDNVNVSNISVSVPSTYDMDIRAGVTSIAITCTWSGSGNITIANLTRPTNDVYYESNMSIYEKATVFVDRTTTSAMNIKRATLLVPPSSSLETWTLYLDLNNVTTYQVSAETS